MRLAPAFVAATLASILAPGLGDPAHMTPVASASTSVELTVTELVSASMAGVCGTAFERTSVWEDTSGGRGRRIVSYTRVRIDRVIDGAPFGEVWVRTLGGIVGDLGQHVDGEAVLSPGQPALMFLIARPDGTDAVAGMGQGHYPLEITEGQPVKVSTSRALGRLLSRPGPSQTEGPARFNLPGRTVDEVAELVASLRRAHAR